MLSDERIAELRLKVSKATSGPWESDGCGIDGGEWHCDEVVALEDVNCGMSTYQALVLSDADADLIVEAPFIAELLDEVERLRARGREHMLVGKQMARLIDKACPDASIWQDGLADAWEAVDDG